MSINPCINNPAALKIVIVRHSLLSRGGDKMVAAHASHLAAMGHDVVIRTNVVDSVFQLHDKVRIEPLSFPGKLGTLLSALFEKQDADVVIADIIALNCFLAVRNRSKLFCFAQDYDESYYTSNLQKYFIRLLYVIGLSLFRIRTIAVADRLAQLLRKRFAARVAVVENGVDSSVFYPDPDPELLEGKGPRKAILLLSRSDPRKGFDLGVSVARNIESVLPGEIEVWTVGEPAARHFAGLKHRDLGYVDENRMRRIMSSADIMLYPSHHEGFGLMVLEAFACRCPVVTTDAVPFARHGENAMVAGIGDLEQLTRLTLDLVRSPESREKLADEGYAFAMDHLLEKSLREFESRLKMWGEAT